MYISSKSHTIDSILNCFYSEKHSVSLLLSFLLSYKICNVFNNIEVFTHTLYVYPQKMNVSENFDSDLKKSKALRVENDSKQIVAYLNINSLGGK